MSTEIYPAGEANMLLYTGTTWEQLVTYQDDAGQAIDLTGYQAKMQVRVNEYATGAPIIELSDGNGITLNSPNIGDMTLLLSNVATSALSPGTYEHDFILTDAGGKSQVLFRGSFSIKQPVTQ